MFDTGAWSCYVRNVFSIFVMKENLILIIFLLELMVTSERSIIKTNMSLNIPYRRGIGSQTIPDSKLRKEKWRTYKYKRHILDNSSKYAKEKINFIHRKNLKLNLNVTHNNSNSNNLQSNLNSLHTNKIKDNSRLTNDADFIKYENELLDMNDNDEDENQVCKLWNSPEQWKKAFLEKFLHKGGLQPKNESILNPLYLIKVNEKPNENLTNPYIQTLNPKENKDKYYEHFDSRLKYEKPLTNSSVQEQKKLIKKLNIYVLDENRNLQNNFSVNVTGNSKILIISEHAVNAKNRIKEVNPFSINKYHKHSSQFVKTTTLSSLMTTLKTRDENISIMTVDALRKKSLNNNPRSWLEYAMFNTNNSIPLKVPGFRDKYVLFDKCSISDNVSKLDMTTKGYNDENPDSSIIQRRPFIMVIANSIQSTSVPNEKKKSVVDHYKKILNKYFYLESLPGNFSGNEVYKLHHPRSSTISILPVTDNHTFNKGSRPDYFQTELNINNNFTNLLNENKFLNNVLNKIKNIQVDVSKVSNITNNTIKRLYINNITCDRLEESIAKRTHTTSAVIPSTRTNTIHTVVSEKINLNLSTTLKQPLNLICNNYGVLKTSYDYYNNSVMLPSCNRSQIIKLPMSEDDYYLKPVVLQIYVPLAEPFKNNNISLHKAYLPLYEFEKVKDINHKLISSLNECYSTNCERCTMKQRSISVTNHSFGSKNNFKNISDQQSSAKKYTVKNSSKNSFHSSHTTELSFKRLVENSDQRNDSVKLISDSASFSTVTKRYTFTTVISATNKTRVPIISTVQLLKSLTKPFFKLTNGNYSFSSFISSPEQNVILVCKNSNDSIISKIIAKYQNANTNNVSNPIKNSSVDILSLDFNDTLSSSVRKKLTVHNDTLYLGTTKFGSNSSLQIPLNSMNPFYFTSTISTASVLTNITTKEENLPTKIPSHDTKEILKSSLPISTFIAIPPLVPYAQNKSTTLQLILKEINENSNKVLSHNSSEDGLPKFSNITSTVTTTITAVKTENNLPLQSISVGASYPKNSNYTSATSVIMNMTTIKSISFKDLYQNETNSFINMIKNDNFSNNFTTFLKPNLTTCIPFVIHIVDNRDNIHDYNNDTLSGNYIKSQNKGSILEKRDNYFRKYSTAFIKPNLTTCIPFIIHTVDNRDNICDYNNSIAGNYVKESQNKVSILKNKNNYFRNRSTVLIRPNIITDIPFIIYNTLNDSVNIHKYNNIFAKKNIIKIQNSTIISEEKQKYVRNLSAVINPDLITVTPFVTFNMSNNWNIQNYYSTCVGNYVNQIQNTMPSLEIKDNFSRNRTIVFLKPHVTVSVPFITQTVTNNFFVGSNIKATENAVPISEKKYNYSRNHSSVFMKQNFTTSIPFIIHTINNSDNAHNNSNTYVKKKIQNSIPILKSQIVINPTVKELSTKELNNINEQSQSFTEITEPTISHTSNNPISNLVFKDRKSVFTNTNDHDFIKEDDILNNSDDIIKVYTTTLYDFLIIDEMCDVSPSSVCNISSSLNYFIQNFTALTPDSTKKITTKNPLLKSTLSNNRSLKINFPSLHKQNGSNFLPRKIDNLLQQFEKSNFLIKMKNFNNKINKHNIIVHTNFSELLTSTQRITEGRKLKEKCESHGSKCVCSFKDVFENFDYLKKNISVGRNICNSFEPVSKRYLITSEQMPRILKNDNIYNDSDIYIMDEPNFHKLFSTNLDEGEEGKITILNGLSIELPCTKNESQRLPDSNNLVKYTWQFENSSFVFEDENIHITSSGSLVINHIRPDHEVLSCTFAFTDPDTGQTQNMTSTYKFNIISLPYYSYSISINYHAEAACNDALLEILELYLPQLIQKDICQIYNHSDMCYVRIKNSVCVGSESYGSKLALKYGISLIPLSSLIKSSNDESCDYICFELISLHLFLALNQSILTALSVPVETSKKVNITPDVKSISRMFSLDCEAGFELRKQLCAMCGVNKYSKDKSAYCHPCSYGDYQPKRGSESCIKCPSAFVPGCRYLALDYQSIAGTKWVFWILFFITVVLLLNCCYNNFISYKGSIKKAKSLFFTHQAVQRDVEKEPMIKSERIKKKRRFVTQKKQEKFDNKQPVYSETSTIQGYSSSTE
ncbi:uncharacterized protein LOC142320009 [Lycorma delicatula]|uniref:uncharacterized protein LOC142320009 n=1 Tax=Lycorma delicatula TaxID=130591 RepID=UPI003F51577B